MPPTSGWWDQGAEPALKGKADQIGNTELQDASVGIPELTEVGFGVLRYVDVTIAAADVIALNATPKQLVAAPGANLALVFERAVIHKPAGTAYDGIAAGEDLAIKYTDGSGTELGRCEMTNFADQATAQTRLIKPYMPASGISDVTPTANAALVAHMLTGEIATGTSAFKFRVYYRIIPTVLA